MFKHGLAALCLSSVLSARFASVLRLSLATVCLAALLLAVLAAFSASAALAPPDVTVLAKQAKTLVRSKRGFRKARLLEADGTPARPNHKVKTAARIVNWRFVFDNAASRSKYASAFLKAHNGKFGKVKGNVDPYLEDQVIKKVPRMTLMRAVKRLVAAGYRNGFYDVTLRKPLFPGVTVSSYIFTVGSGKYVGVNTKTGKVRPIS
jgi:hypothetical protein